MSRLVFIYCVLNSFYFTLYGCQGQVYPSNKSMIVVLPGTSARIIWTFVGDPSKATLSWYFTKRADGSPEEEIAVKFRNNGPIIPSSSLPGIVIEDPATLVLMNVTDSYNGKYRLVVTVAGGGGESSVEFFVAVKPKITINCSSVTTVNQGDYFACKCKGTDGNPPANVTWYKDHTKNVTGKENATLRYPNVKKDASGTYRCVAKSGIEEAKNETQIELIVNYPPENVNLKLIRSGQSATITCTAEAHPEPSVKWYTITKVDSNNVGVYQCVAENILGQRSSVPMYLPLSEPLSPPPKTTLPQKTSQTITNGNGTDKTCLDNMTSGTEWYITVVTLVCGIIVGILLSYIAHCSRRRWFRNRQPKQTPDQQPTAVDSAYQELDLSKMNQEDNYQSLRGNVARINDVTNDNDTENYTELSKTRDVEDNYQSLT